MKHFLCPICGTIAKVKPKEDSSVACPNEYCSFEGSVPEEPNSMKASDDGGVIL